MFRKRNRTKTIVTGMLIGGAAGSLISFLFAPKKGRELRSDIMENIDSSINTIRESGKRIVDETADFTNSTIDKLQTAIRTGINTYRNDVNRVPTSKEIIEETLTEER